MKNSMLVSHSQRLSEPAQDYPKTLCSDYEVRSMEDTVIANRILKQSVTKTVHPQDKFKGFTVDDFAMENIIAAGAIDMLKPTRFNGNTLGVADNVEGSIDRIIAAVDAAENNNETNNEE